MIPDIKKPVLGPLPQINLRPPPHLPTAAEFIEKGLRREIESLPQRIRDAGEAVLDHLADQPAAPPVVHSVPSPTQDGRARGPVGAFFDTVRAWYHAIFPR